MTEAELKAFQLLKKKVELRFRESFPTVVKTMENWTGQEILNFQEDLAEKVNGRISEKWFYTHIKNANPDKLPRIDILNLLSRYANYHDWSDFKNKEFKESVVEKKTTGTKSKIILVSGLLAAALLFAFAMFLFNKPVNENKESAKKIYKLCITDAYKGTPITEPIDVTILKDKESPLIKKADNKACIEIESEDTIKLVISARYYKTDTLLRFYKNQTEPEQIKLIPDDYALMIHIFSKSDISDWKKRKEQLNEMIADEAKIFQVYEQKDLGMELYNKEEFIEKLTMPLNSLRDIEILSTEYRNNKIVLIRFTQKENYEK